MKLEGTLESESDENLGLGLTEPIYERPHIRLIADRGPEGARYFLGTPLHRGEDFPREVMRVQDMANAEINKANLEKKGYVIRIEET